MACIRGRVVDEDEAAISAEVFIGAPGQGAVVVTTDVHGEFHSGPLMAGLIYSVHARNMRHYSRQLTVRAEVNNSPLTLRLRLGREIVVSVVNEAGNPISDSVVEIDPKRIAVTGSDGTATLYGIEPPRQGLNIQAEGFVPQSLNVEFSHDTVPIVRTVVLQRGARVSGKLLGDYSRPVPNGKVSAVASFSASPGAATTKAVGVTYSDLQGRWQMDLGAGAYEFRGFAKGYEIGKSRVELDGISSRSGIIVELRPKTPIAGRILADGAPVAGATAVLRQADLGWYDYATSGPDGTFELYCIDDHQPAAVAATYDGKSSLFQEVECSARTTVVVSRPSAISGLVSTTTGGVSVDRAVVRVESIEIPDQPKLWIPVKSDGTFNSGVLVAGRYRLAAQWHGDTARPANTDWTIAESGQDDVNLRLELPSEIHARVRLNGRSVALFAVGLTDVPLQLARALPVPALDSPRVVRNDDGVFRIGPVTIGATALILVAPSFGRYVVPVDVGPGINDLGEINVPPPSFVSGTVTSLSGGPIIDARVEVRHRASTGEPSQDVFIAILTGFGSVRTDSKGQYRVPVQEQQGSSYQVVINHPEYRAQTVQSEPGHPLRLVLEPAN